MKAPLTVLSEEKPEAKAYQAATSLIAEHIIKSGEGKDNNLYPLANNGPFWKGSTD